MIMVAGVFVGAGITDGIHFVSSRDMRGHVIKAMRLGSMLSAGAVLFFALGCASRGRVVIEDEVQLQAEQGGMHDTYKLSVGDTISVEVFREAEFSGTFQIESGGVIRHALVGSIPLAGKTVQSAEAHLRDLLDARYLVNPRVTLRVLSSQTAQVVVLGEVKRPGLHDIPFDEPVTLLQVIGSAGGFTDLASVNKVRIVREEDGRQRKIRVRVSRIVAGRDADVPVMANDVIMVPQSFF